MTGNKAKALMGFLRKCMAPHHWTLILLMLCHQSFYPAIAQKDSLQKLRDDARSITPRYPSEENLEELLNDRDFNYADDPQPPANSAAKWINWLWDKFTSLFGGKAYDNFWKYMIMAGALALVVFILFKAKVLDYIFPSKDSQAANEYVVGQENIHEINFETAISEALAVGDYRLAIRLQYLKTLKTLSSKQLISWKANRTNHSYVLELERYPYQSDFIRLTAYFEFAWYGDFRVDEAGYNEMKTFSDDFYHKLNQRSHV